MTQTSIDLKGRNPFQLLAYVFYKVRQSLEEDDPRRAPRWVRIIRAREAQGSADIIGKGVKKAIEGILLAFAHVAELVLDIQELLVQTDAAKALLEVSADLLTAVTSQEFINGVEGLMGQEASSSNPLGSVSGFFQTIKDKAQFIPEPDDVRCVGHELFRLLCVVQRPLPILLGEGTVVVNEAGTELTGGDHIDIHGTGKLRLFQWAYALKYTVHGLGPKDKPESLSVPVSRLGVRRLWSTQNADPFALRSKATRPFGEEFDTIFELSFREDSNSQPQEDKSLAPSKPTDTASALRDASDRPLASRDLAELSLILDSLGYKPASGQAKEVASFSSDLQRRLREFQYVNRLPVTGRLDNATLNRLFNLDFGGQNLCRAKPHDPDVLQDKSLDAYEAGIFTLVNGDADHPEEEKVAIETTPVGYSYYTPGVDLANYTKGHRGWIRDTDGAFVGLRSRAANKQVSLANSDSADRFDGGAFSEGEASSGNYFFAARHSAPWLAGRTGAPEDGREQPAHGSQTALYQWVDLQAVKSLVKPGHILRVHATVNIRTAYKPVVEAGKVEAEGQQPAGCLVSDQGRLVVETFNADDSQASAARHEKPSKDATSSDWTPKDDEIRADINDHDLRRRSQYMWKRISVEKVIASDAVAMTLVLEARHQAGWDTDVYFDTAAVTWEIVSE